MPIHYKTEGYEDLVQDLRLACFSALSRVENPTNKRLYNFLKTTVEYKLMDKAKRVRKRLTLDVKERESHRLSTEIPEPIVFGNSLDNMVADLLSKGYTREQIRTITDIKKSELTRSLERIERAYKEKLSEKV